MSKMVKVIAGLMGGSVASGAPAVSSPDSLRSMLSLLQKHNVSELDTARVYNGGKSEETIGLVTTDVTNRFLTATKVPGFEGGSLSHDKVIASCDASLKALREDKIDLYYFHGPDRKTPLEESCRAIHELHQSGKIKAFGVSNYRADEVQEIHDLCARNGWILPTVYQGGYNPLTRGAETKLFPTLRKLGMAFYAFSPLAGGFFSRPTAQLRGPAQEGSRMHAMPVFQSMYINETSLALHEKLAKVCEEAGIGMKEATLRWILHHSGLGEEDGVILGASSEMQMEENLRACEAGPLEERVVVGFESLWREWSEDGRNEGRLWYSV